MKISRVDEEISSSMKIRLEHMDPAMPVIPAHELIISQFYKPACIWLHHEPKEPWIIVRFHFSDSCFSVEFLLLRGTKEQNQT